MSKKETRQNTDIIDTEAMPEAKTNPTARVAPDRLNLRKAASTMADVLHILNKDEELIILEEGPEWTKVVYPHLNLSGYVMSHLIHKM